MSEKIVVRANWFTRMLRGVGLLSDGQVDHVAGADYSAPVSARQSYDPGSAMSAFAAFPWVQAGCNAIVSDLSSLPIKCVRGRGTDAELLDDHPILDVIENPSSRVSGLIFRRQLMLDFVLTGSAFALVIGEREPVGLLRLHPQRTKIVPMPDGQPGHVEYSGAGNSLKYEWSEILHVRGLSWSDDPASLYGSGAIEALHNDLRTDFAASKMAAETAQQGRPTGVFSPKAEGDYWTQQQIDILREAFDKSMQSKSGALFLGGSATFAPLSWSPRDMEFQELRKSVRASVLAALDVPPTRIGLPSANYATSLNQAKRYWESLKGKASLLDAELTRIARLFGDPDVRVFHDFSSIEALQESKSERLNRVQSWYLMGLPLSAAAEMEDFTLPEFENEFENDTDTIEEERTVAPGVVQLFIDGDQVFKRPTTEEGRGVLWRSFVNKLHDPQERRMAIHMRRHLKEMGRRIAKRAGQVLGKTSGLKRGLSETEFKKIMDEAEELLLLRKTSKKLLRLAMIAGFREAQKLMPDVKVSFAPQRIDTAVESQLGSMVSNVVLNTASGSPSSVKEILEKGLNENRTISEIQEQLMNSFQFSASRALRVSRTEVTRAVNAGSIQAYHSAADLGIDIKVEWLSARDENVRDSHALPVEQGGVDGQVIEVGGNFTLPDGTKGSGPGAMGKASEDINCRCTVLPVIGE